MKWTSAFSYLLINYGFPLANVEDQTQRVVFDNNLNGKKIRLRFSNRYSAKPLTLTRVSVGVARDDRVSVSVEAETMCPGALYQRLYAVYPGQVTLLNRGIGGNRVLYDATCIDFIPGNGSCFGIAGVKRFEEDVFGEEQADVVQFT